MSVVTRFAPSPTGLLHAGNYRTAVFAYLYAKKHDGKFILRIEDTDRERSKKEYEDTILESLTWLGLPWDAFDRQSNRTKQHTAALSHMIEEGKAYVSKEEPKGADDRSEVIRFRNPGGSVSFMDEIRGEVTMDISDLGDFVIAKSLDEPLFHHAVVVDDGEMGITHVIRGEDHISNTPRQILIQRALSLPTPTYAHVPLILAPDRSKLSKRKGARAITEYRDQGYLPEAMLNYLALLGWHPQDEKEYFTKKELVAAFDLSRVQKSGAIFDEEKLRSVNQHWMRLLSDEEFIARGNFEAADAARLAKAVPLLKERAKTFAEAKEMLTGELACLFSSPTPRPEELLKKQPSEKPETTKRHLETAIDILASLETPETPEVVKNALMPYADREGRGEVLWPLRYALSGQERSPDPFTIISIIGKEESLARIRTALAILEG